MAREKDCYPAKAACIGPQTPCLPQTQTPDFPRNNLSFRTQMQDFLPQPLFPTRLKLLLLLSILQASTLHPTSASREGADYAACAEARVFSCGSFSTKISYPFLADGRQGICGLPEFQILCESGNPLMSLKGLDRNFSLRAIDYKNKVFTLAEEVSLPPVDDDSCPENLTETTILDAGKLDYQLFSVMEETESLLLFSCVEPLPPLDKGIGDVYKLNCSSAVGTSTWWFMVVMNGWSPMGGPPLNCSYRLSTWLHRTAVDRLKKQEQGFSTALSRGFNVTWKAGEGWCDECTRSGGVCGYNSSEPSMRLCLCSGGNRGGSGASEGHKLNLARKVLIAGSVFGAGLLATLLVVLYFRLACRKKNGSDIPAMEDMLAAQGPFGISRCSYGQLRRMTDHFSIKLGSGGCGSVYKGQLHRNGKLIPVAVKLLHKQEDSSGSGLDFFNEVASIGSTNHVNVVSLRAFCLEGPHRALVYEFMPNGSLDRFIFQGTAQPLGWARLHSIALGIARGLLYLHRGCRNRIVHFDIKPHNILLDENFCPKISDFGLAKLCRPSMGSALSMDCARGTVGYIAPEVFSRSFGVVSSKSDVYSYGMMVLEMVCGRRNFDDRVERSGEVYFPRWAYERLVGDEDLAGACGVADEEDRRVVRKMVIVGLWCIQTIPCSRPSIGRVVEMLEGAVGDLEIPPKPYMCSPIREQSRRGTGASNHSPDSSMKSESSGTLHQG